MPHPSETWLRRVQALLAKAESTEFPAEAETLLAKAQELMARHAIDEAMLRSTGSTRRADVVSETVVVEPPYASARSALLGAVARANDCRLVMARSGRGAQHCVLVGHRSDVDGSITLFAALSLHATRSMLAEGARCGQGADRLSAFSGDLCTSSVGEPPENVVARARLRR